MLERCKWLPHKEVNLPLTLSPSLPLLSLSHTTTHTKRIHEALIYTPKCEVCGSHCMYHDIHQYMISMPVEANNAKIAYSR